MIWQLILDRIPLLESNGASPVNIQDQTTPTLILPMAQLLGIDSIAVQTAPEDYDVTVVDSTGMVVGNHFRIINSAADRYYAGTILAINSNVLTLDTPIDFAYLVGSEVTYNNINMNVNGSVTPVHFHLRTGTPSIPSSVDITRMIMVCETAGPVDLSKFGDLAALTRGIVFRKESTIDGLRNIFNVKTNEGLAGLAYDWTAFAATNPAQGVDGFSWRLTFGGQAKVGVVIRVEQNGQLGLIVQDDLRGLTKMIIVLEGHVVTD